jgi:hypothetical protein
LQLLLLNGPFRAYTNLWPDLEKKGTGSLLSHKLKIVGNTAHSDNKKTSYRPLGLAPTMVS